MMSIASSILNLTFEELNKALHITLEVLSILFSSSSAFMFSFLLSFNKVTNKNDKSFNGNNVGGDLVVNQNTSIYQNNEKDSDLVPALNRLADAIELKHRENVTNIQNDIKDKMALINNPVIQPSEDFMYRYVDNGRNISDKEIQKVWADLYVKEATNPRSVSFRTLEIVKNLTFSEMNLFLRLLDYCIKIGASGYIPNELCNNDLSLLDITKLGDIGLLKSETTLSWTPSFNPGAKVNQMVGDTIMILHNNSNQTVKCRIPVYILTDAGVQLASAINHWIVEENAIKFAKYLKGKHKDLTLKLHKIISINPNGDITFSTDDLLN